MPMKICINHKTFLELSEGATAKEAAEHAHLTSPDQAVAVSINGELRDLATPLKEGDDVLFWNFEDPKGKEIFWHTSAHVLAQAILRLWPEAKPTIGPPIDQGFYYDFAHLAISEEDFEKIEKEVQAILAENYTTKRYLFKDKAEAKARFKSNPYKIALIEGFEEGPITAYEQGEFTDLCRGPHLPKLG